MLIFLGIGYSDAISCEDGDVYVNEDYWMMIKDDETIVSGSCVSGFCCQDDECSFIYDVDSLCAENRDPDSYLCSQCEDGYSESFNSEHCVECDNAIHWEYLLIPLGMAVGMSMFILATHTDKDIEEIQRQRENSQKTGHPIMLNRQSTLTSVLIGTGKAEDNKIMMGSLAKIIVYYEQVSALHV